MLKKILKKILIVIVIIFIYILFRITLNMVYYYKTLPISIKGKVVFESDRSDRNKAFRVCLLYNDKIQVLTENQSSSPSLSRDGKKIVYIETIRNSKENKNKDKIFVVDLASEEKKEIITPDYIIGYRGIDFSPDQEKLLLVGYLGYKPYYLFLYNLRDNSLIELTNTKIGDKVIKGTIWSAKFFPDGKRILLDAELNPPKRDLFIYDLESRKTIDFPYRHTYGGEPAISPDGKKIAYSLHIDPDGTKHDYSEIFIMDADGSNIKKLTNNNWEDRFPCWSPDGKQICFSSFRHKTPIAGAELFVIDTDGTNERRITAPKKVHGYGGWVTDEHPDWANDE